MEGRLFDGRMNPTASFTSEIPSDQTQTRPIVPPSRWCYIFPNLSSPVRTLMQSSSVLRVIHADVSVRLCYTWKMGKSGRIRWCLPWRLFSATQGSPFAHTHKIMAQSCQFFPYCFCSRILRELYSVVRKDCLDFVPVVKLLRWIEQRKLNMNSVAIALAKAKTLWFLAFTIF